MDKRVDTLAWPRPWPNRPVEKDMGLGAAKHFAVINSAACNLWPPDDVLLLPFCVTVHSCTMRRCPHAPRKREGARSTLLRGASGFGLISTSVTTGLD